MMAKCICGKRTRSITINGQRAIQLCAQCRTDMDAAKKLTAACPHPGTYKRGESEICVACGALKCRDGTWEPPARPPRIRRVV